MAVGAPTRPILVLLFTVFNTLVIAFGLGVSQSTGQRRTGLLLMAYAVLGEVALLFAPMHLRGAETSGSDVMHIIATTAVVALTVIIIGLAAAARGSGFASTRLERY